MIIEKPIITAGTLKNNNKDVYYSPLFLEKVASQKGDVTIKLNKHDGIDVGKATKLFFKDDKLMATMDIPDEYITYNTDIGFSTEFIPNKWNGNELVEGYLDSITFLSNLNETEQPNDKNTITRLFNTGEEGNMGESNKLSEMYGKLEKEKELVEDKLVEITREKDTLKVKYDKLIKEHEKLQQSYDEGKALYDAGKEEFEKVSKVAKKYEKQQADIKNNLLEKLVPKDDKGVQDEFKLNMYNKLSIDELKSLVKDAPAPPSTPPNGASGDGMQYQGNQRQESNEEANVYLNFKEAYDL